MAEETQAPVAPQPLRLKQLLKARFQLPPTQRATAANGQAKPISHPLAGTILAASETGFFSGKGNPEFDLVRACRNAIAGPARKLSPGTLRDYAKKARRLHAWQPDQESPPDIEAHCPSTNSYYPYRAAARWAAEENCRKALRERDRAKPGTAERAAAIRLLQHSLATLNRYPPGTDAGIDKHQEQRALATLGLVDPPPQVPMDKRNPRATKAKLVGPLNRKIPDWSQKVWAQLVSVESSWLAQVASWRWLACARKKPAMSPFPVERMVR
jgi:hypothetical protein